MMQYDFQDFSIELSDAIEIECFNDRPHYYGIVFKTRESNYKFHLVHNLHLGYRLYINGKEGEIKDLPFHSGTQGFLPESIKISWKK